MPNVNKKFASKCSWLYFHRIAVQSANILIHDEQNVVTYGPTVWKYWDMPNSKFGYQMVYFWRKFRLWNRNIIMCNSTWLLINTFEFLWPVKLFLDWMVKNPTQGAIFPSLMTMEVGGFGPLPSPLLPLCPCHCTTWLYVSYTQLIMVRRWGRGEENEWCL